MSLKHGCLDFSFSPESSVQAWCSWSWCCTAHLSQVARAYVRPDSTRPAGNQRISRDTLILPKLPCAIACWGLPTRLLLLFGLHSCQKCQTATWRNPGAITDVRRHHWACDFAVPGLDRISPRILFSASFVCFPSSKPMNPRRPWWLLPSHASKLSMLCLASFVLA